MIARVHSVPGQNEGRRKVFLEWTTINLSFKLSVTCESNVNYYESVHHPIPTLLYRLGNTHAVFKTNQYVVLSVECPGIFSSWPKWRGKKGFFGGFKIGGHIVRLAPRALDCHKRWKVPLFVKFERILSLLCFLSGPLINKHCRTWISMINLWIDSKTCQLSRLMS